MSQLVSVTVQWGIGGMNHFMLPDDQDGTASGRFGAFAMELLINELLKRGARRNALEGKDIWRRPSDEEFCDDERR